MSDQGRATDLEVELAASIRMFWAGRRAQADKQRLAGKLDAGLRGSVTGGGHLDGIRELIAELFIAHGVPEADIRRTSGIELPGYYRPTKQWDLVVVSEGVLVAAIELNPALSLINFAAAIAGRVAYVQALLLSRTVEG